MQLQPKMLFYFGLNAPEYQYKPPNEQKIEQKKYLQMFYRKNPDDCFVQLVQTVFSDRYLYQHKSFRGKVYQNKKGYVDVQEVLKQQLISNFMKEMGEGKISKSQITKLINRLSTRLICNLTKIRRKDLFINRIRQSKPLYIQEYPQNDGNQQLQTLLQSTTNIYKIKYRHSENWAMVYAEDPDKIVKHNGHFWTIKTYFRVVNYQKSKQTFDSPSFLNLSDLIKIYDKSFFDTGLINLKYAMNQSPAPILDGQGWMDREDQGQYRAQQFQSKQMDMNTIRYDTTRNYQMGFQTSQRRHMLENQIKQKQKTQYLHPNSQFNYKYLVKQTQNEPLKQSKKQNKLTPQKQSQIDNILISFYQYNKRKTQQKSAQKNKNQNINKMDLQ